MAKCKKCDKPLKKIKFVEVIKNEGVLVYTGVYTEDLEDAEHQLKEQDRLIANYYCSERDALLTDDRKKAIEMVEKN